MAHANVKEFDAGTLRRAMESGDPDLMTGLFQDDAEYVLIDKNHMPSEPLRAQGRQEIAEVNRNLLLGDKTHRVEGLVVEGDSAAFADACEYGDGTRVYCNSFLELDDGKIRRAVAVQAWDE